MPNTRAATILRQERDRKALRLRARGLSYPDILREMTDEYRTTAAIRQAVHRLMVSDNRAAVDEARALHRERIETLMRSLWLAAINPGMAQTAAAEAKQPKPPDQARAIELLHKLLEPRIGRAGRGR